MPQIDIFSPNSPFRMLLMKLFQAADDSSPSADNSLPSPIFKREKLKYHCQMRAGGMTIIIKNNLVNIIEDEMSF